MRRETRQSTVVLSLDVPILTTLMLDLPLYGEWGTDAVIHEHDAVHYIGSVSL